MPFSKISIATIVGTFVLFIFGGIFQAIPFIGIGAVESLATNELTTDHFNEMVNRMAYITTDDTVSFVATRGADYYNLPRFFTVEFLSSGIIACLFALIFSRFGNTKLSDRLWLTFLFSLAATFAIHIPYFNWWGFSWSYTVGVTLRTVIGWILVVFIQNRFIYKIK